MSKYQVKIMNDNSTVSIPEGERLMQNLKALGYELFAQCGGQGTCATCRCKVHEGLPQDKRTPNMYGPLQEKLKNEGWILSCQIPVNNEMTVELFKPLVLKWPPGSSLAKAAAPVKPTASTLSPVAQKIRAVLPGFDCNLCGQPTCEKFAEAVASGQAKIDGCYPGGAPVLERAKKIATEAGLKVS